MPIPLAAGAIIGGGLGALGKLFGGGPTDALRPESRQFFNENIRGFGEAGQQAITGFDPSTGQFGLPSGPFAGPTALGFTPETISEFDDPFIGPLLQQLQLQRETALAGGRRDVSSLAARTGSGRGSRRSVLEAETARGIGERFDIADLQAQIASREQSGRFALAGLPFNIAALPANQALGRFQAGMGAANFGMGPREAFLTNEALTGKKDPNLLSSIVGGAITGAGAVGGGGGGVIPAALPGVGSQFVPQPNFGGQDLFAGANFGLRG